MNPALADPVKSDTLEVPALRSSSGCGHGKTLQPLVERCVIQIYACVLKSPVQHCRLTPHHCSQIMQSLNRFTFIIGSKVLMYGASS